MKRFLLAAFAVALSGFSCNSIPPAPARIPTLPEARVAEIGSLLDQGSFLQALQEISYLHRENAGQVPAADLDAFESRALESLTDAFSTSVREKKFADAVRLHRSAAAYGRPELAAGWTERSLLREQAVTLDASGEKLLSLLARLRTVAEESTQAELSEILSYARGIGNTDAAGMMVEEMRKRGFSVPAQLVPPVLKVDFQSILKGTVTIWVNRGIRMEKGVGYPDRIIGSGFFIDSRGYLLTNYHVVKSEVDPTYEGYSRLFIRLSSETGDKIPAKVVGYDTAFDLALIKAEISPEFVFSGFSAEMTAPGDRIFAIGSPAGLEKTITSGIVSATGRRFLQMGDAIQVDVPLNPGNSGGPLLNEKGEVIGIVFAGLEQFEGINFAIPYFWIQKVLPLLYAGGRAVHPWLGMALMETDKGLEVIYTMPNEPADKGGIQVGDIIISVDGAQFSKLKDAQDSLLNSAGAPSLVKVSFSRGGDICEGIFCLSARPESPVETALKKDSIESVIYPLFGMKLERIGSSFWKTEYVVQRVGKGSVADESGISEKDPLTIQDWTVDAKKGIAILQVYIKKAKQGFLESVIQIGAYLETDSFI
jgi:serine protease Do